MALATSSTVELDAVPPRRTTAAAPAGVPAPAPADTQLAASAPVSAAVPDPARADTCFTALVTGGAGQVVAALAAATSGGGRQDWVDVAARCQVLVNTLTAVQDAAIVQVARREGVWCEDGTLGEVVHPEGRVSLDAADLLAPVIGASHAQAQRRLEQAVRLASGRVPTQVEDKDLPEPCGLGGLHHAMTQGVLDGYRASVIAHELDLAPADVADAVVAALTPHLGDDAPTLRQRTRRLIARISPDLLRQRAQRARAGTGLRRWAGEPGVDEWHGTFPTEDAATAWAAIDRLAHDLVANGTCTHIEQARGKALTDLVTGNATIDVQIVLTVPADSTHTDGTPGTGRKSVPDTEGPGSSTEETTGTEASAATDTPQPERDCPTGEPATVAGPLAGGADDDLVQVQGARPSEPLLVRRGWLRDHLPKQAPARRGRKHTPQPPPFVPCDPLTGARLDPHHDLDTHAYRPGDRLAALVRARDGRCRFPGCTVAARFCDLDHVRPWPTGPTTATNLLTLCRRHHRIKQHPGWSVRLHPDGRATWTDPTGRERHTTPLHALHTLVLTAATDPDTPAHPSPSTAGTPATAWSTLETHLQIRLDHQVAAREHERDRRPTHRRCTSTATLRAGLTRHRSRTALPDIPPF